MPNSLEAGDAGFDNGSACCDSCRKSARFVSLLGRYAWSFMLNEETAVDSFASFVKETEPRLKLALVAAFGR